ncbi:hypothetical protein [Endomicrobium proavitum]|uniref:NADH-ubiquinone/plastoquinone oxidoreductase chain 6 n=1 Tax=Endomicrobium proavitum TaxID=1408281 RepID=A0A0G3WGC8_9BACT|nr:hypothetical protein [Endomicrobium proavitum]AKL97413.1 NADH-ubiquinone/plastoquinone oxidoreductase chain 6 [Endomicrobium proavitum]
MDTPLIHIILLALTVIFAVLAVVRTRVVRAAIMLASISIVVTLILFLLKSPLAAIFELSVCAGLITVIFISVISLTNPLTQKERGDARVGMYKKFVFLPILVAVCAAAFVLLAKEINYVPLPSEAIADASARKVLWETRQFDLLGQIIIILTGVFGVVVLFKDNKGDDK